MRKESLKIARAFWYGKTAKAQRTNTDGNTVWLHGNRIAWRDEDGSVRLTLAGCGTPTTRDRLNTIAYVMGGERFCQRNHVQYYGGTPIESDDIVLLGIFPKP